MTAAGLLPASALLAGALAASAGAATDVYIGVSAGRSGPPQWAIGLPPLALDRNAKSEDADLARRLREVVRYDLGFSRSFKPLDAPSGEAAADPRGRAEDWRKAGAGFVLAWALQVLAAEPGGGRDSMKASVTVSLVDLASGEALLSRYYRQDARHWRTLAHQVSDDVTRQLTGRPGIARTRIAFVNDRGGTKELFLVDYDGEGQRQLTRDRSIVLLPRWRPDGRALVFTSYRDGNPDLFELDLERGRSRTLLDSQGLNLAGSFSPDGAQLVLTQSRQKNPNVYLYEPASRALKPLTSHTGVDSSPTFSPDGGQVAFVSDRSGNPQVHILDLSTARVRRLTRLNWCDSPSWSPTGEWIAFAGRANPADRMDIYIVDVTGSQLRQLTHGEGSNEDPSWSPDGRFLVFSSTRNGRRRELFIMDSDGSAPRRVGDIPGGSYTPSWSP